MKTMVKRKKSLPLPGIERRPSSPGPSH